MNMWNLVFHYANALKLRSELLQELKNATRNGRIIPKGIFERVWSKPHDYEAYIWLLRYFDNHNPTLLIDIGGNSGYWAESFVEFFPNTSILAFEPVNEMFIQYEKRFSERPDIDVSVKNVALSENEGELVINVAKNYGLTSFLEYGDEEDKRNLEFVSKEKVQVNTLNNYASEINLKEHIKIVKIDVQGFETKVIHGGTNILPNLDALIIECSFLSEFKGEKPTFPFLTAKLIGYGFYPILFGVYDTNKSLVGWERDVLFIAEKHLLKSWKK